MPQTANKNIEQELILLRMSIEATKASFCRILDDMAARIDRLLPPEKEGRYQKIKNGCWRSEISKW